MSSRRILLIEDDIDIRESIRQLFEVEGYPVSSAGDGKEAWRILGEEPLPSLIFLDMMMPVMNGWEFLVKLRAEPRTAEIPVVIVSAVASETRSLDVAGFIKKPLEVESLLLYARKFCL